MDSIKVGAHRPMTTALPSMSATDDGKLLTLEQTQQTLIDSSSTGPFTIAPDLPSPDLPVEPSPSKRPQEVQEVLDDDKIRSRKNAWTPQNQCPHSSLYYPSLSSGKNHPFISKIMTRTGWTMTLSKATIKRYPEDDIYSHYRVKRPVNSVVVRTPIIVLDVEKIDGTPKKHTSQEGSSEKRLTCFLSDQSARALICYKRCAIEKFSTLTYWHNMGKIYPKVETEAGTKDVFDNWLSDMVGYWSIDCRLSGLIVNRKLDAYNVHATDVD
ncbi:hypothetical protein EDB19DRAFT_1831870 [Suillus lakei]|nr:hypothetical protein EDB19DRAFT_1831870 [Suillus lakei]